MTGDPPGALITDAELPTVPFPDPVPDRDWWDRSAMTEGAIVHPVTEGEMLLIHKKRGVGAGNLIGPGGKLESGETPRAAGIREVHEETGVRIHEMEKVGELEFVFGEEPFMRPHVFLARRFSGNPTETAEGIPEWHPVTDLPYDRMCEDDRYWLPYLIAGKTFRARFRFDAAGETILAGSVTADVEF